MRDVKIRSALMSGLVVVLAAACGNDTPEPLGDQHIIEIGREHAALDPLSDQELLDSAATKCPVIDRYGRDGFDKIADNIASIHDEPNVVIAMFALTSAAVRAYCPEHIDDMEDWAD